MPNLPRQGLRFVPMLDFDILHCNSNGYEVRLRSHFLFTSIYHR